MKTDNAFAGVVNGYRKQLDNALTIQKDRARGLAAAPITQKTRWRLAKLDADCYVNERRRALDGAVSQFNEWQAQQGLKPIKTPRAGVVL